MDPNLNDGGLDFDSHSQQQVQTPSTPSPPLPSTATPVASPPSTNRTSNSLETAPSTATPVASLPPSNGTSVSLETAPSTATPVASPPPTYGISNCSETAPFTASPVVRPPLNNGTSEWSATPTNGTSNCSETLVNPQFVAGNTPDSRGRLKRGRPKIDATPEEFSLKKSLKISSEGENCFFLSFLYLLFNLSCWLLLTCYIHYLEVRITHSFSLFLQVIWGFGLYFSCKYVSTYEEVLNVLEGMVVSLLILL